MYVSWLDEIEDFRFDVTYLQGSRNLSDPLSRRCFPDDDGPAVSTGDPDAESQKELFSRLGRDASAQGWPRPRGARGAKRPKPPRRAEARPLINRRGAKIGIQY